MRATTHVIGWVLLLAPGCTRDTDTGEELELGPCPDACWQGTDDNALRVCALGSDDESDGSLAAPFATVGAALTASRDEGAPRAILVDAGSYEANLGLMRVGDTDDDGLSLVGCGSDLTELTAADSSSPVLKVSAVEDLSVEGMSFVGGTRTVWIWQGASVDMSDVGVRDGVRAGILVDGSTTLLTAKDLLVQDISADTGDLGQQVLGYGISVHDADVELDTVRVERASRVGVLVAGSYAKAAMSELEVYDTSADTDSVHGRGLMVQEVAEATVSGGVFEGNSDAGIYALRAGVMDVDGVSVSTTASAAIPDSADTTGDGIVITQGDSHLDPSDLYAMVTGCTVEGSARAGVILDGVNAFELSGNTLSGNGLEEAGSSIFLQESVVTESSPDAYNELTDPADYLPLAVEALEVDDLVDSGE